MNFKVKDIALQDFCACLLACADFLDGFVEYTRQHPKGTMTDIVMGVVCEIMTDFNVSRQPFNDYVKEKMSDMMAMPEIQEMLIKRIIKSNNTKS